MDRILISETSIPSNTLHFDADVTKMDGLINEWLSYLKHNILVSRSTFRYGYGYAHGYAHVHAKTMVSSTFNISSCRRPCGP